MNRVMMALGDFRFSLETAAYQSLRRTSEYDWPVQSRIGRVPAAQFTGAGRERLSFSGTIWSHFKGGTEQISAMRAQAGKGQALLLVDGRGKVWGNYAIVRIVETQSDFLRDGTPLKQSFEIELIAYGDDLA